MNIISLYISIVGFIIGSIPSGVLIARLQGIADITQYGSGSSGATNVARLLGISNFFLVFFLDAFKAFIYLFILNWYGVALVVQIWAAMALIVGNTDSIFLQGRGGKGIATSFGVLAALAHYLILPISCVWFSIFYATRTVGIASVASLISLPFIAWYLSNMNIVMLSIFIAAWCLKKHTDNVKRYFHPSKFFHKI